MKLAQMRLEEHKEAAAAEESMQPLASQAFEVPQSAQWYSPLLKVEGSLGGVPRQGSTRRGSTCWEVLPTSKS